MQVSLHPSFLLYLMHGATRYTGEGSWLLCMRSHHPWHSLILQGLSASKRKHGSWVRACSLKAHSMRATYSHLMHACSLIKDELEPHMRDFSPSVVNGLYFERLSFGLVPMSVMGVRIVPPTYTGQNVAIGA